MTTPTTMTPVDDAPTALRRMLDGVLEDVLGPSLTAFSAILDADDEMHDDREFAAMVRSILAEWASETVAAEQARRKRRLSAVR